MFRTLSNLYQESSGLSNPIHLGLSNPVEKKWFIDNEMAKTQMLDETYKIHKAYSEKDTDVFRDTHVSVTEEITSNRIIEPLDERFAVTLALTGPPTIRTIRNEDVRIYNRIANPINYNIVTQGGNTVDVTLQEKKQDIQYDKKIDKHLYLQSIQKYNFNSDIPDTTIPPFDIVYLQHLFETFGNKTGTLYPSMNNIILYNSMANVGEVKQHLNEIRRNTKSSDYHTKNRAFSQLGIKPIITRAPYVQGVEVFWFSNNIFMCRTIEKKLIEYNIESFTVVQLTDIRTITSFSTKFNVIADEFFISLQQPFDSDKMLRNDKIVDMPGLFANIGKGVSTSYSTFHALLPNILKTYHEGSTFILQCGPMDYSLTCEIRAPFLNFEVKNGIFEETRNPAMFSQKVSSVDYHMRPEEKEYVPGMKSFIRLNNSNSHIDILNISYKSWVSVSFAFRLKSIPVKDEIIMNFGMYTVIAKPLNRSTIGISISYMNKTWNIQITPYTLSLNIWYVIVISNHDGIDVYCDSIHDLISKKGHSTVTRITNKISYMNHSITVGRKNIPSVFSYDVAWIHFFDYMISPNEIYRDCMTDWIFT